MSEERANRVIKGMKNDGLVVHSGIAAYTGKLFQKDGPIIKLCKACLENDKKDYGEAYLHRIHQIPGNIFCTKHNTPLYYFSVQNDKSNYEIDINSFDDFKLFEIKPNLTQYYIFLGEDIEFVSSGGLSDFSFDTVSERYRQKLQEKGYVLTGRITQKRLISDFKKFYPIDFLEDLESNFEDEYKASWLRLTVTDSKKFIHPIRHLLFIRFLFGGVKEFLRYRSEYKPFGDGPYPCLNPVADHYKKDVIQSCELKRTYSMSNPVGVFKCDCGFVYVRKGPDKTENDRHRYGKIKKFGHIWEDKLKELVDLSSCVSHIAKEMKCDKSTIIKYATLFGIIKKLNTKQRIVSKEIRKRIGDTQLGVYKEQITQHIISNPDDSRSQILIALSKQYALLYERDKRWLEAVLPKPIENRVLKNYVECIDWEMKDGQCLQKIKQIVSLILLEEKPRRITRNLIARKVNDYGILSKNRIKHSPRTEEYLLSCCETAEDFRQRKSQF